MASSQPPLPGYTGHNDSVARDLWDLLDILVALRMDLGHSANGMAASPALDPIQMQVIRLVLDDSIALTKNIIGADSPPDASETSRGPENSVGSSV